MMHKKSGQIVTFKDRPLYHFKRLDVQKIHQVIDSSAAFVGNYGKVKEINHRQR